MWLKVLCVTLTSLNQEMQLVGQSTLYFTPFLKFYAVEIGRQWLGGLCNCPRQALNSGPWISSQAC